MAGCFTPGVCVCVCVCVCVWVCACVYVLLHYLIDLVDVQSVCNFTRCVFLCMCESVSLSMTVMHFKYDIYFALR